MFERFTDRGRRVVVLAQEGARRLGHDHIGTEHLLLGLLRTDGVKLADVRPSVPRDRDRVMPRRGDGHQDGGWYEEHPDGECSDDTARPQ